jgi:hypothetical protein
MTFVTPKRRWFQFSVRALLVFVTLCAIPCSWIAVKLQQARRQREGVAAIEKLGGTVLYDWQTELDAKGQYNNQRPGPKWLRTVLGDDFFQSVYAVDLTDTRVRDKDLGKLKGWSKLEELQIDGTRVTDAGLEHLKDLGRLRTLSLGLTGVTDAGLENLKGLNLLRMLSLDATHVTDTGLEHLKRLSQLEKLFLGDTRITDAGVKKLQQALPNCKIEH